MHDSYTSDMLSELDSDKLKELASYWDSAERLDDDEAQSVDEDARLDNLSEEA